MTTDRPCPLRRPHGPHDWRPVGTHPASSGRSCPGKPTGAQAVAAIVDYLATPEPEEETTDHA